MKIKSSRAGLSHFLNRLSSLGIGLGVFSLILVMGVVDGYEDRVTQSISRVTSPLLVLNQSSSEFPTIQDFGVPEARVLLAPGVAIYGEDVALVEINGVVPEDEPPVSGLAQKTLHGRWPADKGEVVVAQDLLDKLGGPKIDDYLHVIVGGQGRALQIVGIADFGMYQLSSKVMIVHQNEIKGTQGVVAGIKLFPSDLFQTEQKVRQAIQYPLVVRSWKDFNSVLLEAIAMERVLLFIIMSFIVLMGAFNLVSTLLTKGQEQSFQHGILRALGWSGRSMLWSVVRDGLFGTLPGVLWGTVLGLICVFLLGVLPIIPIPGSIYGFTSLPGKISAGWLAVVLGFTLMVIFIASYLPAYLLTKRPIIRSLRGGDG